MNRDVEKTIVNFLIDVIRKNQIPQQELDKALEKVKQAYYTDATIR